MFSIGVMIKMEIKSLRLAYQKLNEELETIRGSL